MFGSALGKQALPLPLPRAGGELEMARVAFIGLGHMGGGMAPNLAKAGHEVMAFDLSAEALSAAVARG